MATELAKAYVQIIPSAKGIKSGIEKEMGDGGSVGTSFGSKMCSAIKRVITAAAIGKTLSMSISAGADLQQAVGGVETLFKNSANTVIQYANQAYQTAGLSANDYMEQVTSFSASLLQSLSGDTAAAAESANQALIDMSDNANKFGTDMTDIQNAYQGFAKQNYTMLDNLKLGYGGTKTEMQRLLADAQEISGIKYDISNLDDVYSAIHVIQENLDITGTTAKEASTTFSGSFSSMKAAATNLLATLSLGDQATMSISEGVESLVTTTGTFLFGNLIPMIANVVTSLPGAIGELAVTAGQVIAQNLSPEMLQGGVDSAVEFIGGLGQGIQQNLPTFLAQALPIILQFSEQIRVNAGQLIDAGLNLLKNLAQGIADSLPVLIENIPQIVTNIAGIINDNAPKLVVTAAQIIMTLVQGLIAAIPTLVENIPQIVQAIASVITAFDWIGIGGSIVNGIVNGVTNLISLVPSSFTNMCSTAQAVVSGWGWSGLGKGIVQTIKLGVDSIKSLIPSSLKSIGSSAATAFKNISWVSLGRNIISGICAGISGAASKLLSSLKDLASSALEAAKSKLKIASPSKVFKNEVGAMIDAGLAEGIEENSGIVQSAMSALGDMVQNPFGKGLAYDLSADYHKLTDNSNVENSAVFSESFTSQILEIKDDLINAVQSLSERPIILEMYINSQKFAYATAGDMSIQINKNAKLQDMLKGVRK